MAGNGAMPRPEETGPREDAVRFEAELAARATAIRGEGFAGLTPANFVELWPLLKEPIPLGFIQAVGAVTGKPYASTGIKSVQTQIDRMNNVLTPLGWRDEVEYHEEGKVAQVRVKVIDGDGRVLVEREGWGGVNQASTRGNLYKGSYTNAAKLAFARIGPGHEVYIGVTDLDPDVHEETAGQQRPIGSDGSSSLESDRLPTGEQCSRLVRAFADAGIDDMALHLTAVGAESSDHLTVGAAFKLRERLDQHIAGKTPMSPGVTDSLISDEQRAELVEACAARGYEGDHLLTLLTSVGAESTDDLTVAQRSALLSKLADLPVLEREPVEVSR